MCEYGAMAELSVARENRRHRDKARLVLILSPGALNEVTWNGIRGRGDRVMHDHLKYGMNIKNQS
jgi:hypothetical protein